MIHIIAIGSPFNADNISWIIIDKIKQKLLLKYNSIEFIYRDRPGMQLVTDMENKHHVILIDAMLADFPLGHVQEIKLDQLDLDSKNISTHDFSVANALALSKQLGVFPDNLWIYGISVDKNQLLDDKLIIQTSYTLNKQLEEIFYKIN